MKMHKDCQIFCITNMTDRTPSLSPGFDDISSDLLKNLRWNGSLQVPDFLIFNIILKQGLFYVCETCSSLFWDLLHSFTFHVYDVVCGEHRFPKRVKHHEFTLVLHLGIERFLLPWTNEAICVRTTSDRLSWDSVVLTLYQQYATHPPPLQMWWSTLMSALLSRSKNQSLTTLTYLFQSLRFSHYFIMCTCFNLLHSLHFRRII